MKIILGKTYQRYIARRNRAKQFGPAIRKCNGVVLVLALVVPCTRQNSINRLVWIYCGYNVLILWGFIELVSLFHNIYPKPNFLSWLWGRLLPSIAVGKNRTSTSTVQLNRFSIFEFCVKHIINIKFILVHLFYTITITTLVLHNYSFQFLLFLLKNHFQAFFALRIVQLLG